MDSERFDNVTQVIADELRFKARLAIGEDAYTTLKLKRQLSDFWEIAGGVGTGAAVVKSTVVASTFFAPSGLVGLLGLGAAATPVGWVVAAAVLSGGAVLGVRRWIGQATGDRVSVIPKFINTPIDILAVNLFDLICPLALKIAAVDGHISEDERLCIKRYFITAWGYDPQYLEASLPIIESNLDDFYVKDLAQSFAEFSKANPDCNYAEMTRDLLAFIKDVIESDGIIDEREELALEKIEAIFTENNRTFTRANIEKMGGAVAETIQRGKSSLLNSKALDHTIKGLDSAKQITKKQAIDSMQAGKKLIRKFFN